MTAWLTRITNLARAIRLLSALPGKGEAAVDRPLMMGADPHMVTPKLPHFCHSA